MRLLQPYAHSLLRIVAGFMFALHGFQKLFGFFGGIGGHGATAHFFSMLWLAGCSRLSASLDPSGIATIPVALILAGEMATAYFMQHAPKSFWPIVNGGEPAVLYCFIFLFLFTAGGGRWSLRK